MICEAHRRSAERAKVRLCILCASAVNQIFIHEWRSRTVRTSASQVLLMGSMALASVLFAAELRAQVIPDGTAGTTGGGSCATLCTITGGTTAGRNLFHSFDQFSIPRGGGAAFDNAPTIENIFSRVTGRLPSNIDGLLRANGTANVFLLNPNGIIFGPGAQLSIGGSFLATSADSVLFNDGFAFSASNPQTPPLLNVNTPVGLQFGDRAESIRAERATLRVSPGRTLALIGGEIFLTRQSFRGGGEMLLRAPDGRIELGSVAEASRVRLTPISNGFSLGYEEATGFQDITMRILTDAMVTGTGRGSIAIRGRRLEMSGGSGLFAGNVSTNDANIGNIHVDTTEAITIEGSSGIVNSTRNRANGGFISIRTGELNLSNLASISTETTGQGRGGDIRINTGTLSIRDSSGIITSTLSGGRAGDISIIATDTVDIDEEGNRNPLPSRINSDVGLGAQGNGGNIRIETQNLNILNGGQVTSGTLGVGDTGDVTIVANRVNVIGRSPAGSSVSVNTDDDGSLPSLLGTQVERPDRRLPRNFVFGNGGDVSINTQQLTVADGATVTARSFGFGRSDAGNIRITAPAGVEISGIYRTLSGGVRRSGIVTQVGRRRGGDPIEGNAGNLRIETNRLLIQDGATLNSRNSGSGNAGSIEVIASGIELNRGGIITSEMFGDLSTGDAGNLLLRAREMTLNDASLITASTITPDSAGGNIDLQITNALSLSGNSNIRTTTVNGQGGNLRLNSRQQAARTVTLSGGSSLSAQSTVRGNAGNIFVNVGRLWINHPNSSVAASSVSGEGGDIRIDADHIFVQNRAKISASTELGRGGNVALSGLQLLQVNRGGQISASTTTGQAGRLSINAAGLIQVRGGGRLSVASEGGNAGGLTINTRELQISNRGQASVSSRQQGSAGDLRVNAQQILLDKFGAIAATTEAGQEGGIDVTAQQLTVQNGSRIAASSSASRGGDVRIQSGRLTILNGGSISASTDSGQGGNVTLGSNLLRVDNGEVTASAITGRAGLLSINAIDSVELLNRGSLSVQATQQGSSAGGVSIQTGQFLAQNGAEVSVSAPRGVAGNLAISANLIRLDSSRLTAITGAIRGGNIQLQDLNFLLMRNGSQISADARNNANGGNIAIGSNFIVAVPQEDSNINANAFEGRGGIITINTDGIFGIDSRSEPSLLSDITASSEFGLPGTVTITQPDVQPTQGTAELPNTFSTPPIAQGCNATSATSSFVNTGRGGIPQNPTDSLTADAVWQDLEPPTGPVANSPPTTVSPGSVTASAHPSQPIIEAQGWSRRSDGTVLLVAQASTATPHPGHSGMNTTCTTQQE